MLRLPRYWIGGHIVGPAALLLLTGIEFTGELALAS
jgi:hypothetical protein